VPAIVSLRSTAHTRSASTLPSPSTCSARPRRARRARAARSRGTARAGRPPTAPAAGSARSRRDPPWNVYATCSMQWSTTRSSGTGTHTGTGVSWSRFAIVSQRPREVRAGPVHLVHEHEPRDVVRFAWRHTVSSAARPRARRPSR
jgi:hypothetical protein